MDENLNWKSEISHVASKVAKSIGIISRCNFFIPKSSFRMLYCSLIYPYFYYCNIVWASTYKTNLRRLVILQKRIIRIINKSHFNAHTDPIFKDLGILNLMISISFNWANLCILAKSHSYLQSLITISLKAINSTLPIQEIPRRTVYRIVVQTRRSSRPFFKGLSFLVH